MDISASYQAFYVAMQPNQADKAIEQLLLYEPKHYLCCGEIADETHQESQGFHIHYFCSISDTQYRCYIAKLKSLGYLMRGRAEPGLPRTYGKVKQIRDPMKMAAYTIKSYNEDGSPSPVWTNFPEALFYQLLKLSYLKDEKDDTLDVFRYIKENLPKEEERISLLDEDCHQIGLPFQLHEPHMQLKVCILRFFREHSDKTPTRNRVNYLAMRWALKESDWDLDSLCYYFYK